MSSETDSSTISVRLEAADRERWMELSELSRRAAAGMNPTQHNGEITSEAQSRGGSPAAPAYLLWAADNLMREGRISEALDAFNRTIDEGQRADALVEGMDFVAAALHHKAVAAAHDRQTDVAIATYRELSSRANHSAEAIYWAGLAADQARRFDEAAQLFEEAARLPRRDRPDDAGHAAQRGLSRLADAKSYFAPSLGGLVNLLSEALEDRDGSRLTSLASASHFAVGLGGAHLIFDSNDVLHRLIAELVDCMPQPIGPPMGTGDKRYLFTAGWTGDWFRGRVGFLLLQSGRGWQWSGVVLSQATDPWIERWRPKSIQTNQPLPFPIGAPWPAGKRFMAGGLSEFIAQEAAIAAAATAAGVGSGFLLTPLGGLLVGAGVAAALTEAYSLGECGFGIRGFYYNTGPTHDDEDAFAIDFTRYRRGVPYDNESGGTPVLAVADGVVQTACSGISSGDSSASNTVEILHPDPATNVPRYLSRYLHLAGPSQVLVSMGMAVSHGDRLGLMNDTGNSAIDHLHFSIHDQTVPFPGAGASCGSSFSRGASVRPSPMNGQSLDDGDDGKCVLSRNTEVGSVRSAVGKVVLLRVHELGTGFGPPSDSLDAELIVQLDSAPGESFGLPLRRDRRLPAHEGMFEVLRDAFEKDARVRIEFERTGPSVRRILRTNRTS